MTMTPDGQAMSADDRVARAGDPVRSRPLFVITGCPRSGTLFMGEALSRLGHRCGHEQVFNPFVADTASSNNFSFGSAQGDVSWLAAPFLPRLPEGTILFHQLRDPLAVITSLIGQRFLQTEPHPFMMVRYRLQHHRVRFGRPITNPHFIRFAERHCPDVFSYTDEPTRCAHFWTEWTKLVAQAADLPNVSYHRFRIEDLDANAMRDLCLRIGGDQSLGDVEHTLDALGTSTHRARRVDRVGLDAITDPSVRARLVDTAEAYGYHLGP
jgi:hypothetical protein